MNYAFVVLIATLTACNAREPIAGDLSPDSNHAISQEDRPRAQTLPIGPAHNNRVENVFARGDFEPYIPLVSWVEETYGSGLAVALGQETWSVFRIAGENVWIAFVPDGSGGEHAAVVEYVALDFPPGGVTDAPDIGTDAPRLAGYSIGVQFSTASPPALFVDKGTATLAGKEFRLFESSPTESDSMTFRRIFVRNGRVAGISVLVSE